MKHCQENGWKVESGKFLSITCPKEKRTDQVPSQFELFYAVPRPHLAFEAKLATCQSHDLGPVTCPDPPQAPDKDALSAFGKQQQEAEQRFPRRNRRIQIFPPEKTDEVTSAIQNHFHLLDNPSASQDILTAVLIILTF